MCLSKRPPYIHVVIARDEFYQTFTHVSAAGRAVTNNDQCKDLSQLLVVIQDIDY